MSAGGEEGEDRYWFSGNLCNFEENYNSAICFWWRNISFYKLLFCCVSQFFKRINTIVILCLVSLTQLYFYLAEHKTASCLFIVYWTFFNYSWMQIIELMIAVLIYMPFFCLYSVSLVYYLPCTSICSERMYTNREFVVAILNYWL